MKCVSKRKVRILITSVVREGVDFPISPVIAINASGRKSFVNVVQFLGRIVRKNDAFGKFRCYIDFIDDCHPKLLEHSNERIQACLDIGAEVVIVDNINALLREIIAHYKKTSEND